MEGYIVLIVRRLELTVSCVLSSTILYKVLKPQLMGRL